MENKKYKLLKRDFIIHKKRKLYRIKALKKVSTSTYKGELGGYVEGYHNLSQEGDCWIQGEAKVYDNARVRGNSYVSCSKVYDNACIEKKENMSRTKVTESVIHDNANIMDEVISHSEIYDNAKVSGTSRKIMTNEDMNLIYVPIVYKNKNFK